MRLTVELPDSLIEQLGARQITQAKIDAVANAALEIWLAQEKSTIGGPFSESAVPFVQRLIAENHELFDALAHR